PSDRTETGIGIRASADKSVGGYDWLQLPRIPIIKLLNRAKDESADGFIFVGLIGYTIMTLYSYILLSNLQQSFLSSITGELIISLNLVHPNYLSTHTR